MKQLPGLRIRTGVAPDDYAALAELRTRCNAADGTEDVYTAEVIANEMAHASGWDPATDEIVAEIGDLVVGWARASVQEAETGELLLEAIVRVHPDHRGRGIGRALLRATEARLRERAAEDPRGGRRILTTHAADSATGAQRLYESEGYRPVRYYFHMVRADLEGLAPPGVPDDFDARPFREEDLDAILTAEEEAFRDEWMESRPTAEDRRRYVGDPRVDPRLWQVAWHADEVAGIVFPAIDEVENARYRRRRVLLDAVAVRRPFRRRGLATALMLRALHAARAVGCTSADLWVDSSNPSGALRIYERLGFEAVLRSTSYHKELD